MAIDITTLSPAVLKAKNVATESYVNTSTANLANKDMSNVTTIDGGKIDTNSLFSRNITYTGTITGGSGGLGGIIQSKNFVTSGGTDGMKIDLVNGSIYIA